VWVSEWFKSLYETTGINLSIFYDRFDALTYLNGLVTTLKLSLGSVALSVLIGIAGAWLQRVPWAPLRWATACYIHFFRNTPSLVQLYFLYFGIGALMPRIATGYGGTTPLLDNFEWTIVSLSLFGGAFNTEIFRAGIEAVPRATIEAAEALGYTRLRAYVYIVLPLAFRISLPALNNNLVTLVKGTTIGYAVGVQELLTSANTIWASAINIPEMMNILMLTFLTLVAGLVLVMHRFERALRIPGYHR
jgi:polar amino acid transport system permease protein